MKIYRYSQRKTHKKHYLHVKRNRMRQLSQNKIARNIRSPQKRLKKKKKLRLIRRY